VNVRSYTTLFRSLVKHKAELRAEGEAKGRAEGEAERRAEGEAKGRAEGEAKGRAAAKAELLLSLLEQRRLVVPPSLRERVLGTSDELQLQRWFTRAVTATALEEVFDAC